MSDLQSQPVAAAADTLTATGGGNDAPAQGQWRMFLRRFLRHKPAMLALAVLILLYLLAMLAHRIAFYELNPELTGEVLAGAKDPPSKAHWFGTDENGRDVLTRMLFAGRVSLNVGLFVALISGAIGVTVGSVAGYVGGIVDQILMRVTDLFLVVPAIAVLAMAQQGLVNKDLPVVGRVSPVILMVALLSVLFWMQMARVVRGLVLSVKEKEFVEAAKASGARGSRIVVRHILPNVIGPIAVNITLVVGIAIVSESTLSFLGFGLRPPAVSWGVMLANGDTYTGTPYAYLIYFPALALLLTVLCVNFLGDGLRDAFDPQSKR